MRTCVPMRSLSRELRLRARELRSHKGYSFGEVARALDIAPSTARRWTLDIELAPDQLEQIDLRRIKAAREASAAKCREVAVRAQGVATIGSSEGRRR